MCKEMLPLWSPVTGAREGPPHVVTCSGLEQLCISQFLQDIHVSVLLLVLVSDRELCMDQRVN